MQSEEEFEYLAPLKFATPFKYHTEHPPEIVEAPGYFGNQRHRLAPGDEIRVSCLIRHRTAWLKADFEVVSVREKGVEVKRITEWREGGQVAAPPKPKPDPLQPVVYVPEDCEVYHKGGGMWQVRGMQGNRRVYCETRNKHLAVAIARGDEPLPDETAPLDTAAA